MSLLSLESVFILDLDIICPVSSLWVSVNCVSFCSGSAESRVRVHSVSGHYLPREQSLGSQWNYVSSCSVSAESRVRVHSVSGHYLPREQSWSQWTVSAPAVSLLSLESMFILYLDIICPVSSLWVSVNCSCSGSAESRVRVHSGSGHYLPREQSLGLSELCPLLQCLCWV